MKCFAQERVTTQVNLFQYLFFHMSMIADEISVREPLDLYEGDVSLDPCSDSCDSDSEPENNLVYWRTERLSREEFIAVCTNVAYYYTYVYVYHAIDP